MGHKSMNISCDNMFILLLFIFEQSAFALGEDVPYLGETTASFGTNYGENLIEETIKKLQLETIENLRAENENLRKENTKICNEFKFLETIKQLKIDHKKEVEKLKKEYELLI